MWLFSFHRAGLKQTDAFEYNTRGGGTKVKVKCAVSMFASLSLLFTSRNKLYNATLFLYSVISQSLSNQIRDYGETAL